MTDASYVPIMFHQGWALERYYGWSVVHEEPTLKLLRRTRGPITTSLLLARGASDEGVADVVLRHRLRRPFSIAVLNDFSSRAEEGIRIVAGSQFRHVTAPRWFGVGTFIFDLTEHTDALWSRVAARERTKCRKVERLGIKVEFHVRPDEERIDAFLRLYGRMARERGLEKACGDTLRRMFADGSLVMARCLDPAGRNLVINLTYLCDEQGYFLHGARAEDIPAGVGHYVHWQMIRWLKAASFRWYDMGLVPSRDSSDGIYRFKASLGGTFVDFGREFQLVPTGLRAAYHVFRRVRTRIRRLL